MPFVVGETVGPYQLIEPLGQGGMAAVWKAYHPNLDRYVAIKVLHRALLDDPNFLARFQREARVVARLEHPNIVPVYDFAEHEGFPYLVMKFIEGETLKARLQKRPLSAREISRIIETIGAALAYAHQKGILHRDIKPSNVLLAADGQIYLADFGLARIAQMGESSLTADRMVGTPQYMSPEQALAKPDLDARSDIYSMGVLMYELTVGCVPYNADTPFAVIHDHIYTPLPLPSEKNPQISKSMERVLLKALAKAPEDRFQSVESLVEAFQRAAVEQAAEQTKTQPVVFDTLVSATQASIPPVEADQTRAEVRDSAPIPAQKPTKKKRKLWPFLLAGGGLVAVVAVGIILLSSLNQPGQDLPIERREPTEIIVEEFETDPEGAMEAVDGAIFAWRDNDPDMMNQEIQWFIESAGQNFELYEEANRVFAENNAWLLMSMLGYQSGIFKNFEERGIPPERVREILYNAAEDPKAGPFLMDHGDEPLFLAAMLRYLVLHEDPIAAKEELGGVLSNADLLRKYPEAQVLEVELFLRLDQPIRAREAAQNIVENKELKLPDWARERAIRFWEALRQN